MTDKGLIDGDRGILTEKDRKYLMGEIDLSGYKNPEKQEHVFRHRIRKRIERGIKDFVIIDEYLTVEDWSKILEEASEFEADIEETASRTGGPIDPSEYDYPDVLRGLQSGIRAILKSLVHVRGRDHALAFIEENLRDILQTEIAYSDDDFYYGGVDMEYELEEHTIDLDTTFERFRACFEAQDGTPEGKEEFARGVSIALDEFIGDLPEMPKGRYLELVDIFYLTDRLSSDSHQIIRMIMWEMVWKVKRQELIEAIDEWYHLPEFE